MKGMTVKEHKTMMKNRENNMPGKVAPKPMTSPPKPKPGNGQKPKPGNGTKPPTRRY